MKVFLHHVHVSDIRRAVHKFTDNPPCLSETLVENLSDDEIKMNDRLWKKFVFRK